MSARLPLRRDSAVCCAAERDEMIESLEEKLVFCETCPAKLVDSATSATMYKHSVAVNMAGLFSLT